MPETSVLILFLAKPLVRTEFSDVLSEQPLDVTGRKPLPLNIISFVPFRQKGRLSCGLERLKLAILVPGNQTEPPGKVS